MKLSTKSRYGLSCMMFMGQNYKSQDFITIATLAKRLSISKIYLEQVFVLLKRADLVISSKGSQGGYRLSKNPKEITVFEILRSTETSLFEENELQSQKEEAGIEAILKKNIYEKLNIVLKDSLINITLDNLLSELEKQTAEVGFMYHL
jgi:Rrf2 family protein